jgi:phage FluMu protein gp41
MLHTEHEFTLPIGYLDADGTLHRDGVMRLATAADEILPLKDPRVVKNPAYLIVILLSRVVTRLGSVSPITPKLIEDLYAKDLAFLQDLYNNVNRLEERHTEAVCPQCQYEFDTVVAESAGGFTATPWISSTGR